MKCLGLKFLINGSFQKGVFYNGSDIEIYEGGKIKIYRIFNYCFQVINWVKFYGL